MTVDFDTLLDLPSNAVKEPPPLPNGNYFGVITGHKWGKSRDAETPFVEYSIQLTHAGEDCAELVGDIDLTKKTLRQTYYITADALFRLREFLDILEIPGNDRTIRERIPEAIGQSVAMLVTNSPNPKTGKIYPAIQNIRLA